MNIQFKDLGGRELEAIIDKDIILQKNKEILDLLGSGETKYSPLVDSVLLSECWSRIIAEKILSDETIYPKNVGYVVVTINFIIDSCRCSIRRDDMSLGGAVHSLM